MSDVEYINVYATQVKINLGKSTQFQQSLFPVRACIHEVVSGHSILYFVYFLILEKGVQNFFSNEMEAMLLGISSSIMVKTGRWTFLIARCYQRIKLPDETEVTEVKLSMSFSKTSSSKRVKLKFLWSHLVWLHAECRILVVLCRVLLEGQPIAWFQLLRKKRDIRNIKAYQQKSISSVNRIRCCTFFLEA